MPTVPAPSDERDPLADFDELLAGVVLDRAALDAAVAEFEVERDAVRASSVLRDQSQSHAHDDRQHRTLLVRAPLCVPLPLQHPDQQQEHDLAEDQELIPGLEHEPTPAEIPAGGEGSRWPDRLAVVHEATLFVPRVPVHGTRADVHAGKRTKADVYLWEQLARSMLGSYLRTVALQHLNRLAGWRNIARFERDDVPMLEFALIESALYSKPHFAQLWFEDQGRAIPGLSSYSEQMRHFAGTRMPLSWLRAGAAHVAKIMILPSDEPYRIETYADRRALNTWLRHPNGERPAKNTGDIPDADIAYFHVHGMYPPHWRPEQQRRSEWGTASARRSWHNRGNDPSTLLDLPVGLTVKEQVLHLTDLGIAVNERTVRRWRARLTDSGAVISGAEPWHSSTTTRKALS